MKHAILFTFVFNIPAAVSALMILYIYQKRLMKESHYGRMFPFLGALLVATIVDMFFYYGDGILKLYIGDWMWLFDGFAYMLVALTWLQTNALMEEGKLHTLLKRTSIIITIVYGISLLSLLLSDATYSDVLILLDDFIILLVLFGGVVNIWGLCRKRGRSRIAYFYAISISAITGVDYYLYIIGEKFPYELMYINSAFWLIMSFMTITMMIFTLKKQAPTEAQPAFELETALSNIKNEKNLTKREVDILREIYYGKSNAQIADHFGIAENTVKTHVHNLLDKMEAGSRIEAVYMVRKDD